MLHKPLQLNAGCPPGQSLPFYEFNPDGTASPLPFSLPPGATFALTDLTAVPANLSSAVPTMIAFGLQQAPPSGIVQRWNFAGYVAQNIERSFATPILFSTNFLLWNVSAAADLSVNLFGYLVY
jgi:hypothetical protein